MKAQPVKWVHSLGGPLIVMSVDCLPSWGGADQALTAREAPVTWQFDPSAPPTDYDWACTAVAPIGLLAVGSGVGLVLSTETQTATWISGSRGAIIVRPVWVEDRTRLLEAVSSLSGKDFGPPAVD